MTRSEWFSFMRACGRCALNGLVRDRVTGEVSAWRIVTHDFRTCELVCTCGIGDGMQVMFLHGAMDGYFISFDELLTRFEPADDLRIVRTRRVWPWGVHLAGGEPVEHDEAITYDWRVEPRRAA